MSGRGLHIALRGAASCMPASTSSHAASHPHPPADVRRKIVLTGKGPIAQVLSPELRCNWDAVSCDRKHGVVAAVFVGRPNTKPSEMTGAHESRHVKAQAFKYGHPVPRKAPGVSYWPDRLTNTRIHKSKICPRKGATLRSRQLRLRSFPPECSGRPCMSNCASKLIVTPHGPAAGEAGSARQQRWATTS